MPKLDSFIRKEDRAAGVQALREIADKFGAETDAHDHDRVSTVALRLGDTSVMVSLNLIPARHGYLAHWVSRSRRFKPDFAPSVNASHGCKATMGADSFDVLCAFVQSGLRRVASGRAFL